MDRIDKALIGGQQRAANDVAGVGDRHAPFPPLALAPAAHRIPKGLEQAPEAVEGHLAGELVVAFEGVAPPERLDLEPAARADDDDREDHDAADRFDEDRVGLDHIAFRLASKDEIGSAAAHLDELGIAHEPVKDIGPSYILEFRDPDNIALELTAPK